MLKRPFFFRSRYTTRYGIAVLASGMLLLSLIGLILILHFYKTEHRRSLLQWQVVLSLVAESREKEINQWLEEQYRNASSLAENLSLKLYMTELTDSGDEDSAAAAPEYLRILLQVTSERSDFKPSGEPIELDNNASPNKTAGIALLDMKNNIIASTRFMPPITGKLASFIAESKPAERNFLDIFTPSDINYDNTGDNSDIRMIAFLVPVFAVQGDRKPEDQIGYVLGVTEINENLFSKLYQPGLPYSNSETLLVRKNGNFIEYISPLGGQHQGLKLDATTENLDAVFLVSNDGGFTEKSDYRKQDVLAVARKVNVAPWYIIHKIDSYIAFKESRSRTRGMITTLLLSTALMLIIMFAVWRHASSLRSETAAKEYKEIARRHQAQEKLLRLISDNQPDGVSIIDESGIIRFSNKVGAAKNKMRISEIVGKNIEAVFGSVRSKKYIWANKKALESMDSVSYLRREKDEDGTSVYQIQHIPLKEIPDPYDSEIRVGNLVVEQDITAAIKEKNVKERILRRLVQTLTAVVDMRLPYFANHSARVSKVAKLIAREMNLDRNIRETVEYAGKLINLGKIFTPEDILKQTGSITDSEIEKIHKAAQLSAELIKDVKFNGPVIETIRQSQEKMDGSGVLGLKGSEIILPARIIAVADAFVSMASARPYRSVLEISEMIKILMADGGTKYDPAVVAALIHYLENRSADNEWIYNHSS